ncbi:MAG: hypothetical protein U0231_07025 [Nitrospiraceae bacterium]
MMATFTQAICGAMLIASLSTGSVLAAGPAEPGDQAIDLTKVGVFLAAADYRRAVEACQREIESHPSVEAYLHLTYVYHSIDAYLQVLAKAERWNDVEQLYLNLAHHEVQDLVDPPGGLARMAKEMIQTSVRQQGDLSAAMATRLNRTVTEQRWAQQTAWRQARPDDWWSAIPEAWRHPIETRMR